MKRVGKLWIRVFPDVPVSSKPAEVRQGKGKGSPEWWAARVKPGRVLFELEGVPQELAREAFTLAAAKLPLQTKFITRLGGEGHQVMTAEDLRHKHAYTLEEREDKSEGGTE